jgi:hypothetical protein
MTLLVMPVSAMTASAWSALLRSPHRAAAAAGLGEGAAGGLRLDVRRSLARGAGSGLASRCAQLWCVPRRPARAGCRDRRPRPSHSCRRRPRRPHVAARASRAPHTPPMAARRPPGEGRRGPSGVVIANDGSQHSLGRRHHCSHRESSTASRSSSRSLMWSLQTPPSPRQYCHRRYCPRRPWARARGDRAL